MSEARHMTDEEFQDRAIDCLLGGLDPASDADLRVEIVRRGPEGHAFIESLREILGEVALATPAIDPPPGLRARVLDAASSPPAPAATGPRRTAWPWLAAAAFAAVALGLGVRAARLSEERDGLRAVVDRLESRVAAADSARANLAELRHDLDLVAAPGLAVHGLAGTTALPAGGARVFVDPATGRALLYAYDLPILAPDRLYELWAIGDEGPRPAGTFRPDEGGRARLEIRDPALLRNLEALAVTIEPAPGVPQPTGEIVLSSARS